MSAATGSVTIAIGQTSASLTIIVYPAGYTGTKATGNNNTIVIDAAHAGDNFIVVVDTTQNNVNNLAALGTTETERYTESHGYYQSELLTVWRTLWMELDVMAAPTATIQDGFDPANQGTTWSLPGNIPTTEPANFDILAQPTKPDITLLQTAMLTACIEVKEVSQDSGNLSWLVGDTSNADPNDDYIDGSSLNVGQWDTEAPFVHNTANAQISTITNLCSSSRDINVNTPSFWGVQAVGGYEAEVGKDYDTPAANGVYRSVFGYRASKHATHNPTGGVLILFQETIRDFAANGKKPITNESCARTADEINALVTFHETLHMFGFVDPSNGISPDGDIMNASTWLYSVNTEHVKTLSPEQIKKIQGNISPT